MKWKRFLNFIVLAVFALAGVAAVQWYSQQLATATFDDTDVLVVERAAPHALRSATLANLRTYMQIGVPTTNNLASTNYVNAATNGLATGLASTNYVNTATNGLASTNYANTLTNSLASTNYANTLTNSLASTNYVNTATNSLASTNYVNSATNWLATTNYVNDAITNLVTTNLTVNNVSKMYGAQTNFSGAYSLASTTNSPSTLEFATAGWVRSLLGSGAHYYNSTNLAPGWLPTKGDAQPFLYIPDIPAPAVRTYASAYLTNNGYLGGIAITNLTQFEGPFVVATYLGFSGGIATPTITIKPEIYYSYDNGTNLLGDWDTQAQSITHGQTNLYSWVISVPSTVSTGGTFTVYRLFKIVSASFGGSPTLSVHVGTNTASHISFTEPVVAGGTYSGTFVGSGSGLTNIHMTNVVDDAGTALFSQSGDQLTFSWFGGQETIVFGASGDMITLAPNVTINTNLIVVGTITGNGSGITNVSGASGSATNAVPIALVFSGTNLAISCATPAGTITNAPLHFRVTLTNAATALVQNPSSMGDGQRIMLEFIQDGTGGRLAVFDSAFAFGDDITGITLSTTASKRDFGTFVYNSTAAKWYCVGFVRGY